MNLNESDKEKWEQFVAFNQSHPNETELNIQVQKFLDESIDHIAILKFGLSQSSAHILASFQVLERFTPQALIPFLQDLLSLVAYSQRHINEAAELIIKMPRDWVVANIEKESEQLLSENSYYEYQQIMSLYQDLDQELASRFAQSTLTNPDPDIRDIGKYYLGL